MLQGLASEGYSCGRYKVRSLMKALNLHAVVPKRYKVTTDSAHGYPLAPNLLMRKFSVPSPDMVWTADITYIWTLEGWLYLGVVMDLFSRQILGWAAENHMRTDLPLQALHMAWHRRRPSPGLIHHSDRGVQYASGEYRKQLETYRITPSMSRKGNCWDNAPMERFFRSLKSEYLNRFRFSTRDTARCEIIEYITFYNAYRIHSSLGYASPLNFEERYRIHAA